MASNNAEIFFKALFGSYFEQNKGFIEIRQINNGTVVSSFYSSIENLLTALPGMTDNVYFGVAPRQLESGKKNSIRFLTALWCDLDYGEEGHKKKSRYPSRNEAIEAINTFPAKPSLIVDSGNGFHVYWLLARPEQTSPENAERILRSLILNLGGDTGTHDITRILRVPNTKNTKDPNKPKAVTLVHYKPERRYELFDFEKIAIPITNESDGTSKNIIMNTDKNIDLLSPNDKDLVLKGNNGRYESRSEADYKVIHGMINSGFSNDEIKEIFDKYPIGEKHREQPKAYLKHSIQKARRDHLFSKKTPPIIVARNIISLHKQIYSAGNFYLYKDGCYRWQREESAKQMILNNFDTTVTSHKINDVLNLLKVMAHKKETDLNQLPFLNIKNGLFDLNRMQLLPHSDEVLSTAQINASFIPSAKANKWLQTLSEIFQDRDDYIEVLQEFFGLCLTAETKFEKALFLLGEGANGKSVILHILSHVLGSESYAAIPLEKFPDTHYVANLFGKLANISIETYVKADVYDSIFKAVVSGDEIQADHKFGHPFKFKPFCKLIFALNNMPRVSDKSAAFFRRLIIIPFERQFKEEEQNKNLKYELEAERDGILAWMLEGLHRLKTRKTFTNSKNIENYIQQYREENNNVISYVNEMGSLSANSKILKELLFQSYKAWCYLSNHRALSKSKFGKELQRQFASVSDGKDAKGNRVWEGIELISSENGIPTQSAMDSIDVYK